MQAIKIPARAAQAASLRCEHADWTLERIGVEMHLTKERVRQLLNAAGARTCRERPVGLCKHCGGALPMGRRAYCSSQCYFDATHSTVYCDWCGGAITRLASLNKSYPHLRNHQRRKHFCDRTCRGRWLGHSHGFGTHPEQTGSKALPCEADCETNMTI